MQFNYIQITIQVQVKFYLKYYASIVSFIYIYYLTKGEMNVKKFLILTIFIKENFLFKASDSGR
jgi:hypothetical protein